MNIVVKKNIEVKHEGTLVFLYVDHKPIECYLMHELEERQRPLIKAQVILHAMYKAECKNLELVKRSPVTYDSFVRRMAGPNVVDYVLWDGSKTHPIMWPNEDFKAA